MGEPRDRGGVDADRPTPVARGRIARWAVARRDLQIGAVVFIGVVLANVGNYVFQLIAGRYLGPAPYGDLAALLTVTNLILLPLGGLQIWVARNVAELQAAGEVDAVRWFVRRTILYSACLGAVATVVLAAGALPLKDVLSIESTTAVALTTLIVFPGFVTPVVWGLAQGLERFWLISIMVAALPLLRIAIGVTAFAAGAGVAGAMGATLCATLATLAVPLWFVRDKLVRAAEPVGRIARGEAATSLLPAMFGLLAMTALTSLDVIIAKREFADDVAGLYGGASLIGRLILYVPAAIVMVLLPRVAARTVARRTSLDILGMSLLATMLFSAVVTAVYAAVPGVIIDLTFGSAYAEADDLLWRFGLAMGVFAILNILLIYHLGRREHSAAWLLVGGAVAQMVVFVLAQPSPRELVWIDLGVAVALLIAHELMTRGTAVRAVASVLAR